MLTAKGTEYDQVIGLDCGADDYVTKPFGMMALMARIKAVLRRSEKADGEKILQFGDLQVNPKRHLISAGGTQISLTLKEFELLCLLLENQGVVFTRDQLLNRIWGYSFDGESRTVDVHVRHLRQKLGDCGAYIETVRGYRLSAGRWQRMTKKIFQSTITVVITMLLLSFLLITGVLYQHFEQMQLNQMQSMATFVMQGAEEDGRGTISRT